MVNYIIRRLIQLPLILFGVTLLIFVMIMALGPYERLALHLADGPPRGDAEGLIELYGLNDPFIVQYGRWLLGDDYLGFGPEIDESLRSVSRGVLRGDLGFSYQGHQPVVDVLKQHVPISLELALWASGPIILIGIQLGVISAANHNNWIDQIIRVLAIIGWSFPTFVFGLLMLMFFYAKLDWFPAGRLSEWALRQVQADTFNKITHMVTIDSLLNLRFDIFIDAVRHIVLPVVTLSYLSWALLLRVTRSSMLEVARQDYVTTARAKGLPEKVVVNRHIKSNALIPIATLAPLTIVGLLTGVVITETVFNIHGMGWFFARAAINLDIIAVLGLSLFVSFLVVLGNLASDLLYATLDPRVRYN